MDGPENPDTLNSMDNLGITLGKEHKYQESEKLLRTAYETALRNLGPINSTTRESLGNLATTLAYEKRADESISLFEKLLTNSAKAEGGAMVDAHYQYAVALASLGRKEEAFQHLQKAVRLGLANVSSVTTDDDLKTLKDDPRFQPLIEQVKKNEQTAK